MWAGRCPREKGTPESQEPPTSHALHSHKEASSGPAVVEEASLSLPGFLPRGAFFTDTSESESELESDLVMSTVAFPISESESTLESESEPDSTFCRHRVGLARVGGGSGSAPKHSSTGHNWIAEASVRSLLALNLHPAHGRALPPPALPSSSADPRLQLSSRCTTDQGSFTFFFLPAAGILRGALATGFFSGVKSWRKTQI